MPPDQMCCARCRQYVQRFIRTDNGMTAVCMDCVVKSVLSQPNGTATVSVEIPRAAIVAALSESIQEREGPNGRG